MKQFIFTLLLAVGLTGASFASTADLFNHNEAAIEAQFEQIDAVEAFVLNNNITYTEMETQGHLAQFDLNWNAFDKNAAPMFGLGDMDWNAFVCGFCCWPVGIFTIILNDDKDSDSKTSYLVGVGVSLIFSLISGAGAAAGA